ncbi:hypothetical protein ACFL3G_07265, partial [Planctomycetota bacterium]
SRLLMPEELVKDRIELNTNDKGEISLDQLDDIARWLDVSLVALIYRIANIYWFKPEETKNYIEAANKYLNVTKPRISNEPDQFSERYRDLAQRALREGKISLMQFAKYMGISYRKAHEYLTDDDEDFTDETISISIA